MQTAEASAESRSRLSFVATGRGTGRGRLQGAAPLSLPLGLLRGPSKAAIAKRIRDRLGILTCHIRTTWMRVGLTVGRPRADACDNPVTLWWVD